MTTKEAFQKMIAETGIYKTIGLPNNTVSTIRTRIKEGRWPTEDKMVEMLQKAGYKVLQEKLWQENSKPKK